MLRVYVIDKGQGINRDQIKKFIKVFSSQGEISQHERDEIGMGLNICQKIVEKNGGRIDVFSEGERQGATFMFTMRMSVPLQVEVMDIEPQSPQIEELLDQSRGVTERAYDLSF